MILPLATRSQPPSRGGPRRAVAAAEFAVVLPFLGALIMGMCEMARLVMVKDILTNSARKGCRTGVTPGKTYQNIVDDVNNILTDNSIASGNATVTVQVASYSGSSTTPSWGSYTTVTSNSGFSPGALDKVSVKVSLPVSSVLWFAPLFISNTAVESETLTMLKQG
jgi:Flp pilus assembly protein TadG